MYVANVFNVGALGWYNNAHAHIKTVIANGQIASS